jgi:hypothetical protein
MKAAYSLYDNNVTFYIFCYRNSLYINSYDDKCLSYKLQIKLSILIKPKLRKKTQKRKGK